MTKKTANSKQLTKSFGPLPQQPRVTPSEAEKYRQSRKIPENVAMIERSMQSEEREAMAGGNPLAIASVPEQARALRNDIDLIYQYVHDNVEFIPTYGLHKGGLGALIDGSGNQFDQCDLMVQMLNQPGSTYSAQYVIGQIKLTAAQWSTWLGLATTDWSLALQIFNNGGIAVHGINTEPDGTVSITFEHCWVKATIGGTNYYFDPSFKEHTATSGINLASAMSYSRSTFLADAKATATINAGVSVKNVDAVSIKSHLKDYSTNLVNWIKANNPGATFDQIVGGRTINPTATVRNTTLPYGVVTTSETSSIPDSYKCYFQFDYDFNSSTGTYTTSVGGFTDVIYGQRFTLFWNASGQAGVYFNGTQVGALSRAKVDGAIENARLTVQHPYSFANQQTLQPVIGRAPAWLGTCFGLSSSNLAQIHQELQNQYFSQGLAASSEPLLGQSLSLIWDNLIGQSSDGIDILKRLSNAEVVLHHFVGLVTQAKKPGTSTNIKSISSFMSNWNTSPKAAGVELSSINVALSTLVQSLEGTAAEQVSGVESGDAIKAISISNQAGVEVFDGNNSNWTTGANVRNTLFNAGAGWNSTLLTEMDGYLAQAADWRVFVPKNPNITIGSFTDFYGYFAFEPASASHGMSLFSNTWFGAKGAASAGGQDDAGTNTAASDNARQVNGFGMPAVSSSESARVNMLNGRYEYSSTDLSVGNQGEPYELAFVRSYNSALRLSLAKVSTGDNGLGFGWSHNWLMRATVNSNGFISLGDQQVSAAAPAIATLFVMRDIALSDTTLPVENFVIECEVARFLVGQFANNVVRIQAGGSTLMFLKMPDGTYLPPLGAHGKSKLELLGTSPSQFFQFTTSDGIVYKYKSSGEIDTITYPFGITITFTYTSGRLTKVSNGFRDLNFTYDTFGQLATVNDGNGRTVTFTVPTTGPQAANLTAVQDALNKTTTYNYDQRGRLTQVFKPANPSVAIITNTYDTLNRVKEQLDAYNNRWQFFIAGTRSEEVAPNDTSRITYFNEWGSPVRTINALAQEVLTKYDGNQRAVLQTLPEGNSVSTTYDADGNTTAVMQSPKPGSGLSSRTVSYTYETVWNKIETATDTAGNITTYEYYPGTVVGSASRTKKITAPAVAAGIPITTFEYNSIGQLTKSTDPLGLVTLNVYETSNKRNLLSQTIDPAGIAIQAQYTYDSVGNIQTQTDPMGNVGNKVFDALRRPTQVTGPAPFNQFGSNTYDDNGNVVQAQRLINSDPNCRISTFTYAFDGQILTAVGQANYAQGPQPIPAKTEYDSLRRVSSKTDPSGRRVAIVYDALSRPSTQSIDGVQERGFSYSPNGLVLTVSDARNNITHYTYDGLDRLRRITYPDGSFEEIVQYDSQDNVLLGTNRNGDTFSFTYDSASRILTKAVTGMPTVTFTYDLAGQPVTVSTPTIPGDPSTGTFTFGYDTAGRRISEQTPDGKNVITVLDKNSNPLILQHPDGSQVTSTFDELDRTKSISGFGGSANFAYDSASRRISQVHGNGTTQSYVFDKMDQLTSMSIGVLKFNPSLAMAPRIDFAFGTDDILRSINRISSDQKFLWEPLSMRSTNYGTATSIDQYPTVDGVPFTYDDNGCLTNNGTTTYTYDAECRLTSAVKPGSTVTLKYDPFGRLNQKIVGSSTTRYLYCGLQRIEEYDGSGTLQRRYVYGNGLDECIFAKDAISGAVTYLHYDERNSVVLHTDSTGVPQQRNVYSPWGELSSGSLSQIGIGFTGQFYDGDMDLYYYKARYFSPSLGRFLQPDPIGYAGGLNVYEYCTSDPINASDPLGLQGESTAAPVRPLIQGGVNQDVYLPGAPDFNHLYAGYYSPYGGRSSAGLGGNGSSAFNSFMLMFMMMTWMQQQQAAQRAAAQAAYAAAVAQAAAAAAARAAAQRAEALARLGRSAANKTIFGPGLERLTVKPGTLTAELLLTAGFEGVAVFAAMVFKPVARFYLSSLLSRPMRSARGSYRFGRNYGKGYELTNNKTTSELLKEDWFDDLVTAFENKLHPDDFNQAEMGRFMHQMTKDVEEHGLDAVKGRINSIVHWMEYYAPWTTKK